MDFEYFYRSDAESLGLSVYL